MAERVLIISPTDLRADARVTRQIEFLADDYELVVAAFEPPPAGSPEVEFVRLPRTAEGGGRVALERGLRIGLRRAGAYERAYWLDRRVRAWRELLRETAPLDAIVANDLFTLPLAFSLDRATPVVYNAREHWTSESATWTRAERLSMHGAHDWLVDEFVPRVAGLITVSSGIVRDFERRTGVRAELVTNAPYFKDLRPTDVSEPMRMIHMGVADERRRLEITIDAVATLGDRFSLDLVLARDNDYRRRIERMVAPIDNIRLLPAVPMSEVVTYANGYDIGVHVFPAIHPNQVHSLPNKFFDYVQARLALAIGPSPEMAALVREWDCGIVAESFEPADVVVALSTLTPDSVARMKQNSDRAAHVLTAEQNREVMVSVVRSAIATGAGSPR